MKTAKLVFTNEAYEKTLALVDKFSTEVQWHGFIDNNNFTHFFSLKIVAKIASKTGTTIEFPACLYSCVSVHTAAAFS